MELEQQLTVTLDLLPTPPRPSRCSAGNVLCAKKGRAVGTPGDATDRPQPTCTSKNSGSNFVTG